MKLPSWPNPLGYRNIDLGLSRVNQLLIRLDNPHQKLPPTIHLAGTNGKGSTLAFLQAIFTDANLKVHCYTSPHLINFNERIVLAGKQITDDFLNKILQECQEAAEQKPKIDVTFFEGITVAAFLAFSKIKADILLLETGMGGRLDATNVIINPIATIITLIASDHNEFLGNTLKKIAIEKAGIIKPNSTTIISQQKPSILKIIQQISSQNNNQIFTYKKDWQIKKLKNKIIFTSNNKNLTLPFPNLIGNHQIINVSTAIATILTLQQFKISYQNIKNGIQKTIWPARLQQITSGKFYQILPTNFQLFLDGGHNEAGAKVISNWLTKEKLNKNYLICAMLQDKNSKNFLKHLTKQTTLLIGLGITNEPKSKTAIQIIKIAQDLNIQSQTASNFTTAINKITQYHFHKHQNQPAKIIICGSLYLAGEFLTKNCLSDINSSYTKSSL